MSSRLGFSIGALMRLVVLAALNLALFQGVWWVLFFPPIGMLAIVLNITVFVVWVRRRALSRGEFAAALVGLLAAVAMIAYMAYGRMEPWLTTHLLSVLPAQISERIEAFVFASRLWLLESALLLVLGTSAMILAGFLTGRVRSAGSRTSQTRTRSP
jgi:hypothetical protein